MSVPEKSLDPECRRWAATPVQRGFARAAFSHLAWAWVPALALVCLLASNRGAELSSSIEQALAHSGALNWLQRATDAGAGPEDAQAPLGSGPAASAAPVTLNAEQSNLARYISSHYRHAIDFSREVVHHAYQSAREARLDPLLVLAVISVESSFDPRAESPAGAQGLMQVLTRVHLAKFQPFGGVQAAFDPVANLRVGTAILRQYLQLHGTVPLALKAYVGAAHADHDSGYAAKVMAARDRLAAVAAGRPVSERGEASSRPGVTLSPVVLPAGLEDLRAPEQI